jgi:hypothetical protein
MRIRGGGNASNPKVENYQVNVDASPTIFAQIRQRQIWEEFCVPNPTEAVESFPGAM